MVSDSELFGNMNKDKEPVKQPQKQEIINKEVQTSTQTNYTGKVIKRTLFQKTVMLVYPNGNVSVCKGECSSWFTDNKEMWKKKVKKKAAPRKEVKITKEEIY